MSLNLAMNILPPLVVRSIISQYYNLSGATAALYNTVDMLVSSIALKYLLKHSGAGQGFRNLLVSRVSGILAGTAITTLLVGPINLKVALILNVSSFVASFLSMGVRKNESTAMF